MEDGDAGAARRTQDQAKARRACPMSMNVGSFGMFAGGGRRESTRYFSARAAMRQGRHVTGLAPGLQPRAMQRDRECSPAEVSASRFRCWPYPCSLVNRHSQPNPSLWFLFFPLFPLQLKSGTCSQSPASPPCGKLEPNSACRSPSPFPSTRPSQGYYQPWQSSSKEMES